MTPESPFQYPRGLSLQTLLEQVRNTAPFVFNYSQKPFNILKQALGRSDETFSHDEYFQVCVAAHFSTVATFVPTDVDNQIRFKLWHPALGANVLEKMTETMEDWLTWDYTPVSSRYVRAHSTGEKLSGHSGEWFSIAVAAYAAQLRKNPKQAEKIFSLIIQEVIREVLILADLKRAKDGLGVLKAATTIAHNLGDLDRVIEMWRLPEEDPLVKMVFKAGHERPERFGGYLLYAGELNKAFMANENHRHFVLRRCKALRKSPEFLLPIAPFFDDWGKLLAKHPGLDERELAEITEALIEGFEKLKTFGYARALSGILDNISGGENGFLKTLPAATARKLKNGQLRACISYTQKRFEEQWSQMALKFELRLPFRLDPLFDQEQQPVPTSGVHTELSLDSPSSMFLKQ